MLYLVKIFAIKFLDKFTSTTRNILLIRHKVFLSAFVDCIGFIMAVFIIKAMNKASTIEEFAVMCLSVFLADLFSNWLVGKFDKDKEWLHIIQLSNRNEAKEIFDKIRSEGLQIITHNSYNNELDQTLSATIKTCNRNEAKTLKELLINKDFQEITLTNVSSVL